MMSTKEKLQYGTAIGAMLSGAVLSFLSFFLRGDVESGVLAYTGLMVSFAGAVFGLAVYGSSKIAEIEKRYQEHSRQVKEE